MKYIKLYENRHDFVFDEQRYFPNTALVNGEDEPSYFTDVEEVVFELTVSLPTEKVVTGETYTLAVEYGGADVFASSTISTTGDVTLNGTQFTANTDGDFSVTATYGDKTVTLNGTSKLMTAAPTISHSYNNFGLHLISVSGAGMKAMTFNGVATTSYESTYRQSYYEDLTEQTVVVTVSSQESGKWETETVTETVTIPVAKTVTATISDDTLDDGDTAQITVMYGSNNATEATETHYAASGDVTCTNSGLVTAAYSTGSGSIVVRLNNLPAITINVTVAEAVPVSPNIVFADNDVKTIVANAYGSNGEITEAQAAAVTTFFSGTDPATNPFRNNTYVDSFDEFSYFTGVTEIGTAAFYGCRNMTSITIPENVTSIRERSFDYCYLLGSITIPDSVTYIGRSAFQACTGLTTLNLGSYVETIDLYAFKECSSLTSVNIPDSVTTLGEEAFNSCTNLNTVTIGKSVSAIPSAAIPRTISYVSVSSQNNTYDSRDNCNGIVETSTNKLILGCKNTVIPSTVTYIGVSAFSGCTGLTSITIPSTVTAIGDYGFRGCTGLTSVNIPAYVTSIGGYAFNSCSGLTSVTIPDSVTSIGSSAFQYCSGLTSVTIGNSVTSIGSFAFSGCTGLTSLIIPASVTEIAGSAFINCRGLTSIICEATTPPTLGRNAFSETSNCPIFVPAESVDAYKTSWSSIAYRIQAIGVTVSLSSENIVTGETYTLSVKYNGVDVLSNATVTSTGDVTISGSSFTANSDGAFSITATYNGYTATLSGTASTPESEPEYAVAVLDCSELADANPLEYCQNYDESEGEVPEGLNTLDCSFDGEVSYVENGVITIPTNGNFASFNVDADYESGGIVYVKLTHPSAEYKLNADATVLNADFFTCDVTFDSTTLTTTINNVVQLDDMVFDGSSFELYNGGSTDIKITRIEVCYVPASEEE